MPFIVIRFLDDLLHKNLGKLQYVEFKSNFPFSPPPLASFLGRMGLQKASTFLSHMWPGNEATLPSSVRVHYAQGMFT